MLRSMHRQHSWQRRLRYPCISLKETSKTRNLSLFGDVRHSSPCRALHAWQCIVLSLVPGIGILYESVNERNGITGLKAFQDEHRASLGISIPFGSALKYILSALNSTCCYELAAGAWLVHGGLSLLIGACGVALSYPCGQRCG